MVQSVAKEERGNDSALESSLSRIHLNQETGEGEAVVACERKPSTSTNESDASAASSAADEAQSTTSLNDALHPRRIFCDLGYGFPKEERPRRERILAVAKQLVNVLIWQRTECLRRRNRSAAFRLRDGHRSRSEHGNVNSTLCSCARLVLVDCPNGEVRLSLIKRMNELWSTCRVERNQDNQVPNDTYEPTTAFPNNLLEFSDESLSSMVEPSSTLSKQVVYLSPDSDRVLDPSMPPPNFVVVGMLIDRRIQPLRSLRRAEHLGVAAARLPLHRVSAVLDRNEPLNVDCILEGIQRWYWNYEDDRATHSSCSSDAVSSNDSTHDQSQELPLFHCFDDAFTLALQSHQERHPERPRHKLK